MKNTGKSGVAGLILKAILIACLLFFLKQAYAQQITPEIITTTFPEVDPGILDKIERFYEISERSLEIGYNVTLETPSAFKTTINTRERYIVATNFTENKINLAFLGSEKNTLSYPLKTNDYIIFKIDDLNLQFILHSANSSQAQIELKLFRQEIPKDIDYFELFDIKVQLAKKTIYSPIDLSAIIEFTNFGEGPSHTRIIYSIIDTKGKEHYTSIDEKIVETNEIMVKKFNTLKIPNGEYILQTIIYYGDNKEATSEEIFILKQTPKIEIIKQPAIFIIIIFTSFALVVFFKKKKNTQPLD